MRSLGGLVGLLAVALIAGLVYKYYLSQPVGPGTATPAEAIDITGVKNDLVAIAQAERMYQAEHGNYASLDELATSGAMRTKKSGRDGYTYEAETSAQGFRVIARCPAATSRGCSNYAIDQSMEVQTAP